MVSGEALLLTKEADLCKAVFGENADAALLAWLHEHVFSLPIDSYSNIEASIKHHTADSCAEGVAEAILNAPFLSAQLQRRGNFDFAVVCDSDSSLGDTYQDCDAIVDKLLNRFAMGYFKPSHSETIEGGATGNNLTAAERTGGLEQIDGVCADEQAPAAALGSGSKVTDAATADDIPASTTDGSNLGENQSDSCSNNGAMRVPSDNTDDRNDASKPTDPIDVDKKDAPSVVKPCLEEGGRIKMSFGDGSNLAWFGGLVGSLSSSGERVIGFDDGDLQFFSEEELSARLTSGILVPAQADSLGLVENFEGVPRVDAFSFAHEGGRASAKVVGVLLGEMAGERLANEAMYEQHHVKLAAFGPPVRTRRRSTQQPNQQLSLRERLGFRTFRRGDIVQYTAVQDNDPVYHAVVYAVAIPAKKEAEQSRKLLVLYDQEAAFFFLGLWTEWQRVHSIGASCPDDAENNTNAKALGGDEYRNMCGAWYKEESSKEVRNISALSKARDLARAPPPAIKEARAQAKRDEQTRKRLERKREREEAELAAKQKAEAEAKAAAEAKKRETERQLQQRREAALASTPTTGRAPSVLDVRSESSWSRVLDDTKLFDDTFDSASSLFNGVEASSFTAETTSSVPLHTLSGGVGPPPPAAMQVDDRLQAMQAQAAKDRQQMQQLLQELQATKAQSATQAPELMRRQQHTPLPQQAADAPPAPSSQQSSAVSMASAAGARAFPPAESLCAPPAMTELAMERQRTQDLLANQQLLQQQLLALLGAGSSAGAVAMPSRAGGLPARPHVQQPSYHGYQPHQQQVPPISSSPPTPFNIVQVREQLRTARNQQSLETNPEMMRQRQVYIMDLESKIAEHNHAKQTRRHQLAQQQRHMPAFWPPNGGQYS